MELDNGENKIQKICDFIKNETLSPAREQAKEIIENAHIEAEEILKKAHKEKERLINEEKKEIQRQKKIFESSLSLSSRQAIDELKQKIENELFSKNIKEVIVKATRDPQIIASLINAIIKALETEGIDTDISAYIPDNVDARAINAFLLQEAINKLKDKNLLIGEFAGGVQVKLHDMQLTIDISDKALKDLLSEYIRADFRKLIFSE
ncbi:MAG: V-type ATP synthase subunit E [Parachlamydiales bacterium]|jgi:V/A-type H+-transporting ATPase subunit E